MKTLSFFKNLASRADFWPLLAVLFFGWLAARPLFGSGYFNMHDDLQMMRQLQMEKCFLDGQIPCRWVPDMGYGYGFPLFNFYPPLPYLVGQIIRLIGFSFVDTAKGLFIIAFIASGITMYFLGKQFFGRLGGMLASIFYVWAPYHAVDIYVRGAMNEAWALIWFPAILLSSYKVITSKRKSLEVHWLLALSLSWFALLTSHNLMVLIFTPIFAVWCLGFVMKEKAFKRLVDLISAGVFAFGLAAFFTLPVFLEQKLVHADTLVVGYYEYTAHFATIGQLLFSRFWGYGPSVWMDADDKMSFQIGHVHWILSLLVLAFSGIYVLRKRKLPVWLLASNFLLIAGWFAAFMVHSKSTPLWQMVKQLQFVQFPWRFLTLVIFGFSFAIGSFSKLLPKAVAYPFAFIITIFLVAFNFNYFQPEHGKLGALTDEQKFSGAAWDLQRTAGIYDYLPKSARENPRDGKSSLAEIVSGEARISNVVEKTNWVSFDINVLSNEAFVRVNIYQFPEWKIFVDENHVEQIIPKDEKWGRMHITMPMGEHKVYAKLYDTPVRKVANGISLVSWMLLIILIYKLYVKQK